MSLRRIFAAHSLALIVLLFSSASVFASENTVSLQHKKKSSLRRNLQGAACDEILAEWSLDEVSTFLENGINRDLGGSGLEGVINAQLAAGLRYGVQVRKVCSSCVDVSSSAPGYNDFCSSNDYGFDTTVSGMLMIPLSDEGSILPGTSKGIIYCHGTSTRDVPSTVWNGENSGIESLLNVAVASNGNVVLAPDYLGYGESSNKVFKGYVVKKQYQTSVVPLWLRAAEVIKEETDCKSALADAVALYGYSEGGYSAVAIAEGLRSIDIEIIEVYAGGAPFRLSSAAFVKIVESMDNDTFPDRNRHYLALFGSAYSSTYPDVANYGQGQNILGNQTRDSLVSLVTESAATNDVRAAIPIDDPPSVMDPELVAAVRLAIATNNYEPCKPGSELLVEGFSDKICQALRDNDLTETLESAEYPVKMCHSQEDFTVDISNLPDLDKNPLLSFQSATGSHSEAAGVCILTALLGLRAPDFQSYQVVAKHSEEGCSIAFGSGDAPSEPPSPTSGDAPSEPIGTPPLESPSPTPFPATKVPSAPATSPPPSPPTTTSGTVRTHASFPPVLAMSFAVFCRIVFY